MATSTSPMNHDHLGLKLAAMFAGLFAGWTISHWASLAVAIYTVLQIVVLVRDKFLRDKEDRANGA